MASRGTGDRNLPEGWTEDFIAATTTPEALYGEAGRNATDAETSRSEQDQANKPNLLLLLSRGQWSTDFLKKVTSAYWAFDRDKGEGAWPTFQISDARYAPAPTGVHLTDGIVALTAALTAQP